MGSFMQPWWRVSEKKERKKKSAVTSHSPLRPHLRTPSPPLPPSSLRQVSFSGNTRLLRSRIKAKKTGRDNRICLVRIKGQNRNLVLSWRKLQQKVQTAWLYLNHSLTGLRKRENTFKSHSAIEPHVWNYRLNNFGEMHYTWNYNIYANND